MKIEGSTKSANVWLACVEEMHSHHKQPSKTKYDDHQCLSMSLAVEESVDHVLVQCLMAYHVWNSIVSEFDCTWVLPWGINELFEAWKLQIGSRKGRAMWSMSFLLLFRQYGRKGTYAALVGNALLLLKLLQGRKSLLLHGSPFFLLLKGLQWTLLH